MPIYNYICKQCEHVFKAMHSIKDKLTDCPACSVPGLERIPSGFSTPKIQSAAAGDLVKEKIEEFRSDLKEEKDKLSSEDYKP
jgi:putative FmdB family regulatory protein